MNTYRIPRAGRTQQANFDWVAGPLSIDLNN